MIICICWQAGRMASLFRLNLVYSVLLIITHISQQLVNLLLRHERVLEATLFEHVDDDIIVRELG